jgi:hypothetical protein
MNLLASRAHAALVSAGVAWEMGGTGSKGGEQ